MKNSFLPQKRRQNLRGMTMTQMKINTLLIEAPVGRHFAQLHNGLEGLVKSVSLFVETGLRRGTGVVVFASAPHTEELLNHLRQKGLDPEPFRKSFQLSLLDAETTLSQFMRGGMPDWSDFRKTIGMAFEDVKAFGQSATRAYSEMVNILWRGDRPEAAIRLEQYWNELARLHPFSLFCGFMLDSRSMESYASLLHKIKRTHSDIVISGEAEPFREVLDAASKDFFGVPVTQTTSLSDQEDNPGKESPSSAQQAVLWIMRHKPSSSAEVLELAHHYYQNLHVKANAQTKV
jgi:hypothetical protein